MPEGLFLKPLCGLYCDDIWQILIWERARTRRKLRAYSEWTLVTSKTSLKRCYVWQNSCQSQSDILRYFNMSVLQFKWNCGRFSIHVHSRSSSSSWPSVGFENKSQLLLLAFVSNERMPLDTARQGPFEPFWFTWFTQWEKCILFSS